MMGTSHDEHIRVSDAHDLVMCESRDGGHSSQTDSAMIASKLGVSHAPLRMDSQCKYGILARGDAHLYLRIPGRTYNEKIWVRC